MKKSIILVVAIILLIGVALFLVLNRDVEPTIQSDVSSSSGVVEEISSSSEVVSSSEVAEEVSSSSEEVSSSEVAEETSSSEVVEDVSSSSEVVEESSSQSQTQNTGNGNNKEPYKNSEGQWVSASGYVFDMSGAEEGSIVVSGQAEIADTDLKIQWN